MAGFSIVMLTLLLMPLFVVIGLVMLVLAAAVEFVQSAAFPLLIVCIICNCLAFVDVARIAWLWFRARDTFVVSWRLLVRPAVLCAIGFAFFVAMSVVAGGMLLDWYHSMESAAASLLL
ncbi:MAG: hypothetical protein J6D34_03705 [Atopobiaceae bacterium]|nr:hypothetical protein [Atopobiaceae bacterium]